MSCKQALETAHQFANGPQNAQGFSGQEAHLERRVLRKKPEVATMLALAVILGSLGCSQPTDPEVITRAEPVPALAPPLQMDPVCARVSFTFVGSNGINVTYPNRTTCTEGMVVIPGGTPTRNGSGSKNANIPLRLLNRTGNLVQIPVSLVLTPANRVVLVPSGGDAGKVKPQNYDTLRANGNWLWVVGSTGTVANEDSTVAKTFVIRLDSPATSAQVTFNVEAQELTPGGWPLLSTTLPAVDPTKTVTVPGTGVVYFRTNAVLIFDAGVSDQAKQTIFTQYGLTVLGVAPGGVYYVKFADPGASLPALDAFLATLRALPELKSVGPYIGRGVYERIDGRFPSDSLKRPVSGRALRQ